MAASAIASVPMRNARTDPAHRGAASEGFAAVNKNGSVERAADQAHIIAHCLLAGKAGQ
jgi:hypothetical protein